MTTALWVFLAACRTRYPKRGIGSQENATTATGILRAVDRGLPGMRLDGFEEYRGERLYDYMNGAAVTYFEHRFRVLSVCDVYEGSAQAKVELFEMDSVADAAAVFDEFNSPGGRQPAIGQESRFWPGVEPEAVFRRGAHFVRVLVYAEDAAVAERLAEKVASGIDRVLQGPGGS